MCVNLRFQESSSMRLCHYGEVMSILFFTVTLRHSAAADHPSDFVSVLLGKLPMATGAIRVQGLLHGPPSVLCHHKLGHHDLHHWALRSHLPHHVVCFQPEGAVLAEEAIQFPHDSVLAESKDKLQEFWAGKPLVSVSCLTNHVWADFTSLCGEQKRQNTLTEMPQQSGL